MACRSFAFGFDVCALVRSLASRRWAVTLAATGLSIYVLDVVATLAGVALVASDVLGGADLLCVALFLGSTYVFWGFGLRANLEANWDLLERTGTSTSCFSKAAYDVAARGGRSDKARKTASTAGYLLVELIKEAPYYAAAFGTAALSEAVAFDEALIFLGGANIGAACYEFGLARATHALLARSSIGA